MSDDVAVGPNRIAGLSLPALRDYGIYFALIALIAYFSLRVEEFRTWDNAALILLQVSVIGVIAIGMTFTIITAGIDLSVGSLLAIAGIMSGQFAQRDPTPANVAAAFVLPIVVGVLGGALNGVVIAGAGVNPLIVTLATLTAFRGFVVWYRVNPIYDLQPYYRIVGQGSLFGVPVPVIILALVAVTASLVLGYTRFGRYVYAVGGNREAARAAGINVGLVTFSVYVISGLCVGVAALIFTSRLMAAQAISGQGFELQAIAAAVIGGASLFGGRGKISNTIVGALIMGVLFNGFVMLDVSQPIQQMAVGIIIVVSVWLDGVLLADIKKGDIAATVFQDPEGQGGGGVWGCYLAVKGVKLPKELLIPFTLVTPANVDEFMAIAKRVYVK